MPAKQSVCTILIGNGDWLCSGVLLNNVREDGTPYILTAFHSLDKNRDGELSQAERGQVENWRFQFGYMRPECQDNGVIEPNIKYDGAIFRAAWHPTDFALLEMSETPQSGDYGPSTGGGDVYYAGWDKQNTAPEWTIGFNHPMGLPLHLVYDANSPIASDWLEYPCTNNYPGSYFWRTYPTVGFDWFGASGGPLFNPNGLVIGQLNQGCGDCVHARSITYGAFWRSWTGNNSDDTRLSNWLDPDGTGAATLNGLKPDLLNYGETFHLGPHYLNAYDKVKVGSGIFGSGTQWWTIESSANVTIKAGREIHIRPCSWIKSGAKAHLYISTLSCSDAVKVSDPESEYQICGNNAFNSSNSPAKETVSRPVMVSSLPLSVYPTPAGDAVTIGYNLPDGGQPSDLYVIDPLGNRVAVLPLDAASGARSSVDFTTSHLSAGMYYVVMKTVTDVISAPMIIAR